MSNLIDRFVAENKQLRQQLATVERQLAQATLDQSGQATKVLRTRAESAEQQLAELASVVAGVVHECDAIGARARAVLGSVPEAYRPQLAPMPRLGTPMLDARGALAPHPESPSAQRLDHDRIIALTERVAELESERAQSGAPASARNPRAELERQRAENLAAARESMEQQPPEQPGEPITDSSSGSSEPQE